MTTKTSSLALVAAVFTSTALLAGGSAAAEIKHLEQAGRIVGAEHLESAAPRTGTIVGEKLPGLGHGPVVLPKPPTEGGSGGSVVSCEIGKGCTLTPPKPPTEGGSGGSVVSCEIGKGCTVTPPPGDDDDHHHHHGGYGDGYGWGYRYGSEPEIVVGPAPAVPAPVEAVPARAPAAAPQVAQAPCNCLTKQNLPDGSVLFQDICTKQSAIAAPQAVGAR